MCHHFWMCKNQPWMAKQWTWISSSKHAVNACENELVHSHTTQRSQNQCMSIAASVVLVDFVHMIFRHNTPMLDSKNKYNLHSSNLPWNLLSIQAFIRNYYLYTFSEPQKLNVVQAEKRLTPESTNCICINNFDCLHLYSYIENNHQLRTSALGYTETRWKIIIISGVDGAASVTQSMSSATTEMPKTHNYNKRFRVMYQAHRNLCWLSHNTTEVISENILYIHLCTTPYYTIDTSIMLKYHICILMSVLAWVFMHVGYWMLSFSLPIECIHCVCVEFWCCTSGNRKLSRHIFDAVNIGFRLQYTYTCSGIVSRCCSADAAVVLRFHIFVLVLSLAYARIYQNVLHIPAGPGRSKTFHQIVSDTLFTCSNGSLICAWLSSRHDIKRQQW